MHRFVAGITFTLFAALAAFTGSNPAAPTPQWLWKGKALPDQVVFFRTTFDVEGKVDAAKLHATCDNEMTVYVNGEEVAHSDSWENPVHVDVAKYLKAGKNAIAVRGRNDGGPAGLVLQLVIEKKDKSKQVVVTDGSWRVADKADNGWQKLAFDDVNWAKPTIVGKLGDGPWNIINKNSLVAASAPSVPPTYLSQLKAIKDFKAELVYSVPPGQGSWVSMTIDPKGRLIASDQYGKLYRVTLPMGGDKGEAAAVKVEPIPLEIGEAQGLLWANDSLYVVVNRHIGKRASGLYRVTSSNGNDELDKVQMLREIQGGGEHGPHAVILGPDDKSLYVCCGNHTAPVKPLERSLVPPVWGEDSLLTRMWDPNGHAVGIKAPGGCIYRTDLDGKKWELICCGFRNQYDAAFNEYGDLFTYDSDMEWDMNTPWYHPTRVFHCVSGGECGWRGGTGKFPTYYPDSVLPVYEVGPGSPTGMTFGYGAKFPAKYQDALYMCDWSYGKLYALHLTPKGATYTGELEEFVRGTPLPLTDIVVNRVDGALYFTVGGRKTQSGLYRVTYTGKEPTKRGKEPNAGTAARTLRKKLEAFHGTKDANAIDVAWPYLGHEDRAIRFAARAAVEAQDVALWQEKALKEKDTQTALTALLALSRCGPKPKNMTGNVIQEELVKNHPLDDFGQKLLAALDHIEWKSLSLSQKLDLLRVYELTFIRRGRPDEKSTAELAKKFDALYPAKDARLNNELCKLLVYLQAPGAAAKTMKLLNAALTQEEQLQYALSLRELKQGWTMPEREDYFRWFVKAGTYKGGNSFQGFVRNIKKDAVANLPAEAVAKLKPIIDAKPEVVKPVLGPPRPFVKKWETKEVEELAKKGLKNRNFDKGRAMFAAANCFACHRFNSEGGSTGPDLTGVSGRFTIHDLVESITEPSKVISDQYEAKIIELENGQVVQGRIVNLFGDTIMINTDLYDPNKLVGVNRKQIASVQTSPISMMPVGLLDTLHQDEVLDLLAYLLSGGNRNHAAFAKKE